MAKEVFFAKRDRSSVKRESKSIFTYSKFLEGGLQVKRFRGSMFVEVLQGKTKENLDLLGGANWARRFYLAGGSATALRLGHRISLDLDFFTEKNFKPKILAERLSSLGKFVEEQATQGTVLGQLNKTRISFFWYRYPLLYKAHIFSGVRIADIRDIDCMKLDAISSRGTRRDFIGLYFICKAGISLRELLPLFDHKYKGVDFNRVHILKSLVYFQDAEKEEMPRTIKPFSWDDLKGFFEREVTKLVW